MGMGRHIFRKQTLAAALILLCAPLFAGSVGGDEEEKRVRNDHLIPQEAAGLHPADPAVPERRGHISTKLWTTNLPSSERIDYYLDYFSSEKGLAFIKRCLVRAEPYASFISERIREKGLPAELLYLPVIESAYRVDAVSRSGATGMWQFMMNSIDPYDITVDAWRDDRRDFWRSTEAALDKLEYNYRKTGDWLLALAAYNCGLGRVTRTVAKYGISDYWELCERGLLPRETRNYIPKLAAVTLMCNSRGAYDLPLHWGGPDSWVRLDLKSSVDLRKIAGRTEMDTDLLFSAHHELNYMVTPPASSGYSLKIPAAYREEMEKILAEETDLIEFKRYRIRSGDTLSELAQWYRIPMGMIYEYNPGVSSRYLRIGQVLLIPLIHSGIPDREGTLTETDTSQWTQNYTVSGGDSLWSISKRFNTSPEELASGNRLPLNGIIKPGMVLRVPPAGITGDGYAD